MIIKSDIFLTLINQRLIISKIAKAMASLSIIALISANAHAAPELSQPVTGSTTIVEQSSDGQVATITATPNSITMQNGAPFAVTQITNVPRYTINDSSRQSTTTITTLSAPITTQVTQQIGNTIVTTPANIGTQVLTITPNMPSLTRQPISSQVTATAIATIDKLQSLQLTPVFSTADLVTANTKIMKVLKDSSGKEFAVPANKIVAGDVIEYHTTYTNTAKRQVNDLNAIVTLPNGITLVSLTSPLPTMAAINGNNYQVIQQVGNDISIQENYSGLQWNLANLAADTPQTVIIRATVQ